MPGVEAALLIVVIVVTFACALIALFTVAGSAKTYGQIGSGGMSADQTGEAADERDEEIRQMLDARNARRARRGEAPLDLESELAALSGQPADPGLRDESASSCSPATAAASARASRLSTSRPRSRAGCAS